MDYLDRLTLSQLEDLIEAIWRGEQTVTDLERELLREELLRRKATALPEYTKVYILLLALLEITEDAKENADPDKKLTAAQLAGAALVISLARELPEPEPAEGFDMMWVAQPDACEKCMAYNGLIYGKDFTVIPQLHPNCRCRLVPVPKGKRAMDKIGILQAGSVRAVKDGKKRILEVLAAPFGSPTRKDKLGQYLSPRTDYMIEVGDRRPLLYFHGYSPRGRSMKQPPSIGVATATRKDDKGLWMHAELDDSELSDRTWKAALEGNARASTGSVNYLERHDDRTGEVYCWPIAELSVFDGGDERIPVSDDAVVLPLRALFTEHDIPYTFEAGEDKEAEDHANRTLDKTEYTMDDITKAVEAALAEKEAEKLKEQELRDAVRAEILEEQKEKEPKHRATFNIGGKVTGENSPFSYRKLMTPEEKAKYDKSELEEADYMMYNLMRPRQAPNAMRVLEETEAAEGQGLIPSPMLNKIIGLRDEISLPRRMGVPVYQTNSLTLDIPREDANMAVFATIGEEGAYIANEPAFSAETVTVVKKGSLITVTEELLEDSTLFEPYFTRLCGRKWGLTENLIFFTEAKADDTAGTHSATMTYDEIDAFMFQITEPWATGAWLIMDWATMGTIRGLLIATPRAYGDFPSFGGLDYPNLFGYRTACDSNWEAVGGGDTTLTMSLINPQAMSWVERRGLQIKVDPYGDSLNGRVRYFPSFRAACATTQILGNVSYTDHA